MKSVSKVIAALLLLGSLAAAVSVGQPGIDMVNGHRMQPLPQWMMTASTIAAK